MSTNEQARYTAEQVLAVIPRHYLPVEVIDMLRAYAQSLTAPAGGVSDAMVALDRALEAVNAPLITDKANDRAAWEAVSVLQSHGATLRAALSAPEPAAQGDAVAWQFRPKFGSLVADEWSWCSKAAHDEMAAHTDAYETRQLYTAPPPEPAAQGECAEDRFEQYVATLIAKAPDVQKLGSQLALWLDDDKFNNVEPILTGIAQELDRLRNTAPPAQPAERVPDGWVMVPREATEAMVQAAAFAVAGKSGEKFGTLAGACYRAMLTASPAPSEGGKGVEG